ncbi:CoA-disulfide reductase [Hujiaoplasma nucleasis]|uniref:CoA-disulfide reductase n=1 Tax=Hujiaoplasma nucleasis TaxID=2725268 RepID=A0A7L6N3T1_9MOLU|nr:CoA-disulfide reductase [Hujiaoplasma nucleasis]QLY39878.1 CoA-disulfide reductase [Hujiaoplasma nucleasis]
MKTIIIGGVAAGMSAASKLRRLNPKMTITVYEMGEDLSYGGCGMPYFLGDVIKDENKLLARNKDDFEKQNIQVYLNHEVTHLDYKHQSIEIFDRENKKTIKDKFDYLVIATGTKANRTNIPGSKEVNPYVLNTLEDARKIKANMKDVKEVAIIGGGYIGLEIAENFAHLGIKVHIIERAKQLLIVYDTFVAQKAKEILEKENIQIYLDEALESYEKDHQKTIIKTNNRTLSVDMVIEAIGVRPNTEFLKNSGIQMLKNGAIITNEYQETSLKNVYSAGDCSSYHHLLTKEKVFVPLGTHANKTGKIIAENIEGNQVRFKGIIGSNILKIADYAFAKTGLGFDEAKRLGLNYDFVDITAKNQSGYYPGAEPIFVRMVYDPQTKIIKGCQMVGKKGVSDRINIMALAITKELTADEFSQLDLAYAPPFSPVWDPLLVASNQIK